MKHAHTMPFGAEVRADGRVRFRLWAPSASRVDLVLERAERGTSERLPMTWTEGGFFELVTPTARAGSRYRYRIDERLEVPDPASRSNPDDPNGASEVVDPAVFEWNEGDWCGRPWDEAVVYELHVGTFTSGGMFRSAIERLPYLAALGVTAIELMPIADFPGRRNWGYDGVLAFAPDASYGTPDDLKRLVEAAHRHGLMIFLDVVYNHFGPEGNYLYAYAPAFFTDRHHTLWGQAINFDGEDSRPVRDFFVHNTLYWLEEYRFDGLRYDAVNAIRDNSPVHILDEIAAAAHAGPGRERRIHVVLENDDNAAHYLHPREAAGYRAQWNDDAHHALHAAATGEHDGYYVDYLPQPAAYLARCLAEGFAYQGEESTYRHRKRGEPSAAVPPTAFVNFLQNHDQVGNRAFGERITGLASERVVLCLTASRRCCSWDRNTARPRRSSSSAISGPSWPRPCAEAGRRSSRASRVSRKRPAVRRYPIPTPARPSHARSSTGGSSSVRIMRRGTTITTTCSRCASATSCRSCRISVDIRVRPAYSPRPPSRSHGRAIGASG